MKMKHDTAFDFVAFKNAVVTFYGMCFEVLLQIYLYYTYAIYLKHLQLQLLFMQAVD